MKKRSKLLLMAILALIFSMAAWGLSFVSNKIVIEHIPPVTSAAIRFLLAAAIMFALFPFFVKNDQGKSSSLSKNQLPVLLLSAFTGISLYFIFENYGLYFTTASSGALITSAIPVMALIFEVAFLRRKINFRQSSGVIISVIGVYLLTNTSPASARNPLLGNLLILGCCVCWVLFNFFSIKIQKSASTFVVTAWQNLFGALFLIPFFWFERSMWKPIPPVVWLHLLYLAVVCSVICYFLYNFSLRVVGSVTAGAFINFIPLVGAVSGVLFLNETLSIKHVVGGFLVIGCIWLIMDHKSFVKRKGTQ